MINDITIEVAEMATFSIEGNIIPAEWFSSIKLPNGKTDSISILILSEIIYWYRPAVIREEISGKVIGHRKKFKADLLQRSYSDLENLFGFSRSQIKDSLQRLEKQGLILRVFRNIHTNGTTLANVMFIQIFPKKIKLLTLNKGMEKNLHTYDLFSPYISLQNPIHMKKNLHTYTKSTTKNTSSLNLQPEHEIKEREMIKIWNEVVEDGKELVKFTTSRKKLLRKQLIKFFNDNCALWREYCLKIISSKFLMGEITSFKVQFDWALKDENIIKILENAYRIGDRNIKKQENNSNIEMVNIIIEENQKADIPKFWQEIKAKILKEFGEATYNSWFKDIKFIDFKKGYLEIAVKSNFIKSYLLEYYENKLTAICSNVITDKFCGLKVNCYK